MIPKRYRIHYDSEFIYKNPKRSSRAGKTVKVKLAVIASDTDYSFSVVSEDMSPVKYLSSGENEISFTMPSQDVTVRTEQRNTMSFKVPEA